MFSEENRGILFSKKVARLWRVNSVDLCLKWLQFNVKSVHPEGGEPLPRTRRDNAMVETQRLSISPQINCQQASDAWRNAEIISPAVGKMAWKLQLQLYLDKLTLSEPGIQGPLWPFIMKKAFPMQTQWAKKSAFWPNLLAAHAAGEKDSNHILEGLSHPARLLLTQILMSPRVRAILACMFLRISLLLLEEYFPWWIFRNGWKKKESRRHQHEFGISQLSTLDGSFPCCPQDHPSSQ